MTRTEEDYNKLRAAAERLLVASNAGREAIQRVVGPLLEVRSEHADMIFDLQDRWKAEAPVFKERALAAKALEEMLKTSD